MKKRLILSILTDLAIITVVCCLVALSVHYFVAPINTDTTKFLWQIR